MIDFAGLRIVGKLKLKAFRMSVPLKDLPVVLSEMGESRVW